MVNGNSDGFFPSSRGLRQGDPLSPLLFIIIMEALSRMLERAAERGLLGKSNGVELMISQLLFADDTLIFCGADLTQLRHLQGIFI